MVDPDSARALRPLRQFTLPGGRTLLRAGLVAALLGLAAAVLHTPAGCPPTAVPSDAPSVEPASTARRSTRGGPAESSTGFPDTPGPRADPDRPSRQGQSQCGGRSASSQSSLPPDRSPQPRSVSSEVCSGSTTKSSLRSTARSSSPRAPCVPGSSVLTSGKTSAADGGGRPRRRHPARRPGRRPWARRPEATGPPAALVASDGVTTPSGGSTPDDYWRRPDTGDDAVADHPPHRGPPPAAQTTCANGGTSSGYAGPPPSVPPPSGLASTRTPAAGAAATAATAGHGRPGRGRAALAAGHLRLRRGGRRGAAGPALSALLASHLLMPARHQQRSAAQRVVPQTVSAPE